MSGGKSGPSVSDVEWVGPSGMIGMRWEKRGSTFQVRMNKPIDRPNQNILERKNPGQGEPSVSSVIIITGSLANGNTMRSYSTHCFRRITVIQKQAIKRAANRVNHQNKGINQTSQGKLCPRGSPSQRCVMAPVWLLGTAHGLR